MKDHFGSQESHGSSDVSFDLVDKDKKADGFSAVDPVLSRLGRAGHGQGMGGTIAIALS